MVTSTRRGPIDSTPRSTPVTRRSKRNLDTEETPTMLKKRRTAPKASSSSRLNTPSTSADAETTPAHGESMPVRATPPHDDASASARQGSPKVVVPLSSPAKEISLESEIQASIIHTPSPPREEARPGYVVESVARQIRATPTPAKPKAPPAKERKARGIGKRETIVEDASDTVDESGPAEPKNTKIRFGSEEPGDAGTDTPVEPPVHAPLGTAMDVDDVYESDSDEAPEEVTTSAAAIKAKAAEVEAARAFEAQQKKLEQKRKERLSRVADEQRQKREKEARRAAKHAKLEARAANETIKAPFKFDMNSLPSLLPTELLEAAGDKRPPTPPLVVSGSSIEQRQKEKLARHIKFLEKGEKPIKDVKKGKLNVHVLGLENKFLQPKVNTETKSIREKWLRGREDEQRARSKGKFALQRSKVERRAVSKGFLRGDD